MSSEKEMKEWVIAVMLSVPKLLTHLLGMPRYSKKHIWKKITFFSFNFNMIILVLNYIPFLFI